VCLALLLFCFLSRSVSRSLSCSLIGSHYCQLYCSLTCSTALSLFRALASRLASPLPQHTHTLTRTRAQYMVDESVCRSYLRGGLNQARALNYFRRSPYTHAHHIQVHHIQVWGYLCRGKIETKKLAATPDHSRVHFKGSCRWVALHCGPSFLFFKFH